MAVHAKDNNTKRELKPVTKLGASQVEMSALPLGTPVLTDLIPFTNNQGSDPVSQNTSVNTLYALLSTYFNALGNGSTPAGTDKFPIVRAGSLVDLTWTQILAAIPTTGSFDPFQAKITANGQIEIAINTNHYNYINIDGNITLQSNLTLLSNTVLFLSPGARLQFADKIISSNGVSNLSILSDTGEVTTYAPTVEGNNAFQGGGVLIVRNMLFGNIGTAANTPITDDVSYYRFDNVTLIDNGQPNSCVNSQNPGSAFNDCGYVTSSGPLIEKLRTAKISNKEILTQLSSLKANRLPSKRNFISAIQDSFVVVGGGTVNDLAAYNISGATNNLITIGLGSVCAGLSTNNGSVLITNGGTISGLVNNTTATITMQAGAFLSQSRVNAVQIGVANVKLDACTTGTITLAGGASGTSITNCYSASALQGLANDSLYSGAANTGAIPNTTPINVLDLAAREALTTNQVVNGQLVGQKSDGSWWTAKITSGVLSWIPVGGGVPGVNTSPYDGVLDAEGTLPYHYATFNAAYTAVPAATELNTIADITETVTTQMVNADQGYVQIGQNKTWNLQGNQILGAAGVVLTVDWTDASAIFQYGGTLQPFAAFDNQSTISLNGAGGSLINTSTGINTYIQCPGTLLASDIYYILPNTNGGGFYSNTYTNLRNIIFQGGGNACQRALVADGGALRDIVFYGPSWLNNGKLIDIGTNGNSSIFDTIYFDVNASVSAVIKGNANNINRNRDPLYTSAFLSLTILSDSTLITSYPDGLVLPTGITNVTVSACRIGLLALSNDNTNTAKFVGVKFDNVVTHQGNASYTDCDFNGGITIAGGTASISNSRSVTPLVITGGTVRRGGANDANIGNDLAPTVTISGTTQQLASNTKYICTNATQTALQLPADSASVVGDTIVIAGLTANGWQINQAVLQQIVFGPQSTTAGTGGNMHSNGLAEVTKIMKVATSKWQVLSSVGNLTLT